MVLLEIPSLTLIKIGIVVTNANQLCLPLPIQPLSLMATKNVLLNTTIQNGGLS
jgi:hypothetical protein